LKIKFARELVCLDAGKLIEVRQSNIYLVLVNK